MRIPFLIFCLILLSLETAGCSITYQTVAVEQEQATGLAPELFDQQEYGQTFVVQQDGLSRIDLYMATYARTNTHPVLFQLYRGVPQSNSQAERLVELTIPPEAVSNSGPTTINFQPLPGTAGEILYFSVQSPGSVPGNAFTVYQSDKDMYPGGDRLVDRAAQPGDLAFIAYTQRGVDIQGVLADFQKRAQKSQGFFVPYCGLVLFVFLFTVYFFISGKYLPRRK